MRRCGSVMCTYLGLLVCLWAKLYRLKTLCVVFWEGNCRNKKWLITVEDDMNPHSDPGISFRRCLLSTALCRQVPLRCWHKHCSVALALPSVESSLSVQCNASHWADITLLGCIGCILVLLRRILLTTVIFCLTLVVARWGLTPTTSGSCLCHEHTTNLATGVSRLPVLDCGTTFHAPGLRRPGLSFDSFRRSLKTHLFGNWSA